MHENDYVYVEIRRNSNRWTSIAVNPMAFSQLVNERRHMYYAVRQGRLQKHRDCYRVACYVVIKSIEKIFVSLISPNTKDREYQNEPKTMLKIIRSVHRMNLYRIVDLIKCII